MRYLPRYCPSSTAATGAARSLVGPGQRTQCPDWPSKFRLDVWYVDRMSLLLDVRILFMTVSGRSAGISQVGENRVEFTNTSSAKI